MADNPGQFPRDNQQEISSKGGQKSSGKFGSAKGADPQKAGQAGAKAQPTEAKAEGGRNSRRT